MEDTEIKNIATIPFLGLAFSARCKTDGCKGKMVMNWPILPKDSHDDVLGIFAKATNFYAEAGWEGVQFPLYCNEVIYGLCPKCSCKGDGC